MNMPLFTAEASLWSKKAEYQCAKDQTDSDSARGVIPQLPKKCKEVCVYACRETVDSRYCDLVFCYDDCTAGGPVRFN